MTMPFFNAGYYLASNPDVARAGYTVETAYLHYTSYGAAEMRAPAPWFDAKAYLLAHPDLQTGGVTLATALHHYAFYGCKEGRLPAPNVDPGDFSYSDYAAANADLRSAFGIADPNTLTPESRHLLLAHFLAYGWHEGRAGIHSQSGNAASYFGGFAPADADTGADTGGGGIAPEPPAGTTVEIDGSAPSKSYLGSAGDDVFVGIDTDLDGAKLYGNGGHDTLEAHLNGIQAYVSLSRIDTIVADVQGAGNSLTIAGVGVKGLTVQGGGAFAYSGVKVDSVTLKGKVAVSATFDTVPQAGSPIAAENSPANDSPVNGDTLKIFLGDKADGRFSCEGIDHFFVAHAAGASALDLSAGSFGGDTLSVVLTGGAAGAKDTFALHTKTGQALKHGVLDGSAVSGDQKLSFVTAGRNQDVQMRGGAGHDILNGSLDIDTMTGGSGDDIFVFDEKSAAVLRDAKGEITQMDTITDFHGHDILRFSQSVGSNPGQYKGLGRIDANHFLHYEEGYIAGKSVSAVVSDIQEALSGNRPSEQCVMFQYGDDAYCALFGSLDGSHLLSDALVKLTGVSIENMHYEDMAGGYIRTEFHLG